MRNASVEKQISVSKFLLILEVTEMRDTVVKLARPGCLPTWLAPDNHTIMHATWKQLRNMKRGLVLTEHALRSLC